MTKEEIIEGNKLIDEFNEFYLKNLGFSDTELNYNTSWDCLMPCIGKISDACEEPEELDNLKYALLTNNIEEAWKFVVNYLTIS